MKTARRLPKFVVQALVLQLLFIAGCSTKNVVTSSPPATPPAPYCSNSTTYSSSTITVSGTAYYAPRVNGDGEVADGGFRYRPTSNPFAATTVFSITINGTSYSVTSAVGDNDQSVSQKLVNLINADANAHVTASQLRLYVGGYQYWVLVNEKNYGTSITSHSASGNMTEVARTAPNPIRYAEIMVKDSSGNIIQCGQTSGTGTYSLTLPQGSGSYNVYINSRILDSTKARVYVLDYDQTNLHYSISKSVSASSSSSSNNLVAPGTGTLEAGAFNILDQIIKANEYLAQQVTAAHGCGTTYADCVPFTAAPIVYAYWKPGMNPHTYFGSSSPASFYVGNGQLYILGGSNGDVDNSDCDHFDNSVIIHEYGHFIDDSYSTLESPGGPHDGNSVIDPRLAFSEGWADFFQAAVRGANDYRDTVGNSSGNNGAGNALDISTQTQGAYDVPTTNAEGLFREFSITRTLWHGIDPVNFPNGMAQIWSVLTGVNNLRSPASVFRHMGTFLKVQDTMANRSDWSSLRSTEYQNGNAAYNGVGYREYATPVTFGACGSPSVQMSFYGLTSSDPSYSDNTGKEFLKSNDYYTYYHAGGTLTVQMTYTTNTSVAAILHLYLFNRYYQLTDPSGSSTSTNPSNCVASPGSCTNLTETISVNAPAGYYLIDVLGYSTTNAIPASPATATYGLKINGTTACPAP